MTETTIEVGFTNFKEIEGIIKFMTPVNMGNFCLSQYLVENGMDNELVKYLIDNPNYSGFITVKYKFEEYMNMYMGDRYLMDMEVDWNPVEHWIPPIDFMERANKDYLENKLIIKGGLEPLIINRNRKHYTRQLLNKKINGNSLDEIMKFI